MAWEGVSFFTLAELVLPKDTVTHVFFKGHDGYSTNTTIDALMERSATHHRARRPRARHRAQALRLERCQVGEGNHFPQPRHPRLLGNPRLLQHRRSLDRGSAFVIKKQPLPGSLRNMRKQKMSRCGNASDVECPQAVTIKTRQTKVKIVIPAVSAKKKMSIGGIFFMSPQHSKTHAKKISPALSISMALMNIA
jgi:hypothetical protein